MAYRTSIFIDFWNFSLQWRNRAHGDLIDWRKVPARAARRERTATAARGLRRHAAPRGGAGVRLLRRRRPRQEAEGLAGRVPRQAAPLSRHHPRAPLQTEIGVLQSVRALDREMPQLPGDAALVDRERRRHGDRHGAALAGGRGCVRRGDPRLQRHRLPARRPMAAVARLQGDQRHLGQPRARARARLLGLVRARRDRLQAAPVEPRRSGSEAAARAVSDGEMPPLRGSHRRSLPAGAGGCDGDGDGALGGGEGALQRAAT